MECWEEAAEEDWDPAAGFGWLWWCCGPLDRFRLVWTPAGIPFRTPFWAPGKPEGADLVAADRDAASRWPGYVYRPTLFREAAAGAAASAGLLRLLLQLPPTIRKIGMLVDDRLDGLVRETESE